MFLLSTYLIKSSDVLWSQVGSYHCLLFTLKKKISKREKKMRYSSQSHMCFRGTWTKTAEMISCAILKIRLSFMYDCLSDSTKIAQTVRPADFLSSTSSSMASLSDVLLNCSLPVEGSGLSLQSYCFAMLLVHMSSGSRSQVHYCFIYKGNISAQKTTPWLRAHSALAGARVHFSIPTLDCPQLPKG